MFDAIALAISDVEQPPKYEDIGTPAVLTVETETRAQTQPDCQNAEGGAASTSASAANK